MFIVSLTTVIEMFKGEPPYAGNTRKEVLHFITQNGTPNLAHLEPITAPFRAFLKDVLTVHSSVRPSASLLLQVRSLITNPQLHHRHRLTCNSKHPFLSSCDPLRTLIPLVDKALAHRQNTSQASKTSPTEVQDNAKPTHTRELEDVEELRDIFQSSAPQVRTGIDPLPVRPTELRRPTAPPAVQERSLDHLEDSPGPKEVPSAVSLRTTALFDHPEVHHRGRQGSMRLSAIAPPERKLLLEDPTCGGGVFIPGGKLATRNL